MLIIEIWKIFGLWTRDTIDDQRSNEVHRVVAPGGSLIVIETMTIGSQTPAPPTFELAEYYRWIEETWGFSGQVIRTDYIFCSVEDAITSTKFFFGEELAEKIERNQWVRLPEWTAGKG